MGLLWQLNGRFYVFISMMVLLVFAILGQSHALEDHQVTTATGTSKIVKEDIASARENAISEGLKTAVKKVAVDVFSQAPMSQDIERLDEMISKNTKQFIQRYQVRTENRSENLYTTIVEVHVSLTSLKKAINVAAMNEKKGEIPDILLCVTEKSIGESEPKYWWRYEYPKGYNPSEKILALNMKAKNFHLANPKAEMSGIMFAAIKDKPKLSKNESINLGKFFKADIVITGYAVSTKAPKTTETSSETFVGTVTLKALKVDSGQVIASTHQKRTLISANPVTSGQDALFEAGRLAGEDLANKILKVWDQELQSDGFLHMEVSGTSRLALFVIFRSVINQMHGVREVNTQELFSDIAILHIKYDGAPKALAQALMSKSNKLFYIEILEVTPDRVRLSLVPKPA